MKRSLLKIHFFIVTATLLLLGSCAKEESDEPEDDGIYQIPVVVHVIHKGEAVGEGYNLSDERITGQIRTLNEDFRRMEGTRGFNSHPDGADTKIEFVLAKSTPDGQPTTGINRINSLSVSNPVPPNQRFDYNAHYGYWDYDKYLNIWIEPLPESTIGLVLGEATGPDTDLPGNELFNKGEPIQAEGVLINSFHFGVSTTPSDYNLGRTLTHEVGHYLGLLHPWGSGDCATNDYCDDTPPVAGNNNAGCTATPPLACNGMPAMIENYMDYTPDSCMNIFTNDQAARMHYVLENTVTRKSLLTSPGLQEP